MKNLLKIFFCIFLLIGLCACKKDDNTDVDLLQKIKNEKHFVVGINENSKPFAYKNSEGKLEGFDIELIKEISKDIFGNDKIIEFRAITPSSRILKLNSGELDVVISTMTITSERLSVIDFSNPYFLSGQAVLVKKDSNIRSGKDLNNKIIGIVLGTTAATNIKYIAPNSTIKGFKNYQHAFMELALGNIDAISTDDVILQGIISDTNGYKLLPDRYSKEYYGIALRKDEKSTSLKNAINSALERIEKNGKMINLEKKYNVNYKRNI